MTVVTYEFCESIHIVRMRYDRPIPGRISYRLPDFDYAAPGSFFVTICTKLRQCIFGDVIEGMMHRNPFGEIVHQEWLRTAIIRPEIELDEFIVMPNHFHGIIHIVDRGVAGSVPFEPAGAHRRAPIPNGNIRMYGRGCISFRANGAHGGAHGSFHANGAHGGAHGSFHANGAHGGAHGSFHTNGAHGGAPLRRHPGSLGSIIAGFKSTVTTKINSLRGTPRQPVWQSRYHERVIRTEQSLQRIRTYIRNNPMQWHLDKHNPKYGF